MTDGNERSHNATAIKQLIESIGTGDEALAHESLSELGLERGSELYLRVGGMTRALHDSLQDFQRSLSPESITMQSTNIPDASSKLEAVISMTFEAASTVLRIAEEKGRIIEQMEELVHSLGARLQQIDPAMSSAAKNELVAYETQHQQLLTLLRHQSEKLIISQNYQDLSGQSLKKVIKLISNLEQGLISILQIFDPKSVSKKQVGEETGDQAGTLSQGDADQILKDLGF